jgi:membrane peptidoglycan carboxypeptidase
VDSRRKADWGTFQDSCDGPQRFPGFNPRNDANEGGANYSALESTKQSINTGFIGMAKELDLCGIRGTAEAFGVHRADGDPLEKGAGSVLGTNEVAPLTMAAAFAGIANNGATCSPIVIDKIIGPDGSEQPIPQSTCTQSVDPAVAAGMTYAMRRALEGGTGSQSFNATRPKVPMIGKTGTTDGSKDTWINGASSKVATVVGVVSLTGDANQRSIRFENGRAADARHKMWPAVMSVANAKYGGDEFTEASTNVIRGAQVPVPDVRGKSLEDAEAIITDAGLVFADGGAIDSEQPAGTVVGMDPAPGEEIGKGSTVTVQTSNGSLVLLPDTTGLDEAAAQAALSDFAVTVREQQGTDQPQKGKVLVSEPAAGTPVKAGSPVTIVVGK